MRKDALREFVRLREQLTAEREHAQRRLAEINEALGMIPPPSLSAVDGAIRAPEEQTSCRTKAGRRSKRGRMTEAGRARIAAAARARWAAAKAAGRSRL